MSIEDQATMFALLAFAVFGVALAVIDVREHRLPNAIVLPAYPIGIALFGISALMEGDPARLLRGIVGMAALFGFYFLLRFISPRSMGGGDVKLAGVIGLLLGWIGWDALAIGASAAFLLGGVFGCALMLLRRASASTRLAFGPWMIVGAWSGILGGAMLA